MRMNYTDEPDTGPNREPAHLTGATRADRIHKPYTFDAYRCMAALGPSMYCTLRDGHEGGHVWPAFRRGGNTMTCIHCGRTIIEDNGVWIDPEATGDDSVWRETCDAHDTFMAEHEPDD